MGKEKKKLIAKQNEIVISFYCYYDMFPKNLKTLKIEFLEDKWF